jgi:hypothetical protein
MVFRQTEIGEFGQHRLARVDLQEDVLKAQVAVKKILVVNVADPVEELESDPLSSREPQIVVPLADVLPQCLVTELHLVFVTVLIVPVDLDDVWKA